MEGGWWDWIQSAKDKVINQSTEVFDFVKKDIEEFSKVVSEETTSVVKTTATSLREKLQLDDEASSAGQIKKNFGEFFNHVAEVFTPPPDDGDQETIVICNQEPIILNKFQAAKYAVCSDPSTFLKDPEGEEDQYETWLQYFKLEEHDGELSKLLADNDALNQCYLTLVPTDVSHVVFWHRYFYKIGALDKAEAKLKDLKLRTQNSDEHIFWEEDENDGEDVEISEQMQNKLLEDYEKEQAMSNSKDNEELTEVATDLESNSKGGEDEWEKIEKENPNQESVPNDVLGKKAEDWENWE